MPEILATLACGIFAGAAIYVNLVEQPARLSCGITLAVAEWRPSYKRGSIMQASVAILGSVLGVPIWVDKQRLSLDDRRHAPLCCDSSHINRDFPNQQEAPKRRARCGLCSSRTAPTALGQTPRGPQRTQFLGFLDLSICPQTQVLTTPGLPNACNLIVPLEPLYAMHPLSHNTNRVLFELRLNRDRTEKIDREYLRREALLEPTRSGLLASEAG